MAERRGKRPKQVVVNMTTDVLLTPQQLKPTPSELDGIPTELETALRVSHLFASHKGNMFY